jgi:cobalt ECF transporter T component CbiQ
MIPSFLLEKESAINGRPPKNRNMLFVDKTTKNMAAFLVTSMQQWNASRKKGLLQELDARVKVLFVLAFIILTSLMHSIEAQIALCLFVFILLLVSKVNFISAYGKAAFITLLFGLLMFIPASLNLFSHGRIILPILKFDREHTWWIYTIPTEIGITREGLVIVTRLSLKVFNSVSLAMLLIHTTTFDQIAKALRMLKVPGIFVLTLTMSYKYIYLFSQTVVETYQALKMRWWSRGNRSEANSIIAGRMGYLFRKSWERYELVYQSMVARGFTGNADLVYSANLAAKDYRFLAVSFIILLFIILFNYSYARYF